MKLIEITLDDYDPHPQNPNTHPDHQVTELGKSLGRFGQFKNVVVWQGFYLAGHGLVEAARKEGLKTLQAVDVSHLSEEGSKSLMVADNRLPDLAEMDFNSLNDLLQSFDDPLEIPGIDDDFIRGIDPNLDEVVFREFDESVRDEVIYVKCPECNHRFPK